MPEDRQSDSSPRILDYASPMPRAKLYSPAWLWLLPTLFGAVFMMQRGVDSRPWVALFLLGPAAYVVQRCRKDKRFARPWQTAEAVIGVASTTAVGYWVYLFRQKNLDSSNDFLDPALYFLRPDRRNALILAICCVCAFAVTRIAGRLKCPRPRVPSGIQSGAVDQRNRS
jgi:hypothetical protein